MKKNTFFFLLLIILHNAHSQCTIENEDQTLIGATTGNSGQSFTPTCNGILDNIRVVATFSTLVTVTLRSGEGYSGTILGTLSNQSTSPSGNPITFTEFDFSTLNIILIAGQSYTFDVSSEINLIYDNDDALDYIGGQRYQNGSAQVGTDLLFNVNLTAIPCTDPDVPMVTHSPTTICNGESTTLTINGNLNDATEWHIYTGSCGGTEIGTTTSSTFVVTPSAANTTYFVRGEGGLCVVPGACGNTNVVVTPDDVVTFNAPADLCIDAGIQTGLGDGSPSGGTYSGNGVTDDGNGTTYSFNPTTAGTGTHTITYTSSGTCSSSASDTIEVFELPIVSFTAPADLCVDAGIQTGLGGGTPSGGTYSGNGVTDDGNGTTYSFNPTITGTGNQNITYSFT
ncbi:Ig-like domain-containing protein, partial [Aquimarina sp. 433]